MLLLDPGVAFGIGVVDAVPNSGSQPDGFRNGSVAVFIALLLAITAGVAGRSEGGLSLKANSLLLFSGAIGTGLSASTWAARRGTLEGRDKALLGAILSAGVAALWMVDLGLLANGGLRVSTPFAVALVMALLGLRRGR